MPDYFRHDVNSKARYAVDWDDLGWLPEGAQITSSTYTEIPPSDNVNITGEGISEGGQETTAMIEITAPGVYTVRNHVTANDASYGDWDLILNVPDPAVLFGYLSIPDAEKRLFAYWGITGAELAGGDIATASDEIDQLAPFIGTKRNGTSQTREFPRSMMPDGSTSPDSVPDGILNAVARLAYHISEDEDPAITGESQLDRSITYASAKASPSLAAVYALVRPHLRKTGGKPRGYEKHPDDVGWPVAFETY